MIVLVTDFGLDGPYTGQVRAVLADKAPGIGVIDLFADAPPFDPQAAAYLIAAYADGFPSGSVFLCVIDPGVGSERRPCCVLAGHRWFIGPDNGLFDVVVRRAHPHVAAWRIDGRSERASATFHGRDVFAPVAASLARGGPLPGPPISPQSLRRFDWPDDLARIVYVDGYGNAISGMRASMVDGDARITVGGLRLGRARCFADVSPGEAFWYENANGLLEIAVNCGRAADDLGLRPGTPVLIET
ncbi:MAG: SAM-dependent chlorinase/fluorinase [Rhodospirillales bacterium]|nr:SAM-dependent chlorinase/fluorinase [Rhodospirillales bacterium]